MKREKTLITHHCTCFSLFTIHFEGAEGDAPVTDMTPELYCDVFEQLERGHVRYCVVGGVAVVLHGYVRPVADLDIVIDPDPTESQRAMHALTLAGFVPSIPVPISLLTVMRMFDRTQREVDVVVRFQIPFNVLWPDAQLARVGKTFARIASLDHVIRAKQIRGRSYDCEDSENLLKLVNSPEQRQSQ